MLIAGGGPPMPLTRVMLGSRNHASGEREAFVQDLVHEHPKLVPMGEIEPAFTPMISICKELPTAAGYLDNLWVTPAGGIVLGECKLFRNPEARREVVAQALDYARALGSMTYQDLQEAVGKARHEPGMHLWSLVRDQSDLDEAEFIDAVERRLRQSRFMIVIIGDGIQEGVEALTSHLQLHAGLHVGLALVDLSIWRDSDNRMLVLPRIPLRTVLVERGIVTIDSQGLLQVRPPQPKPAGHSATPQRAYTASEPEFFDQLEQRRPGVGPRIRHFLDDVADLGITPEFRRSLTLRWRPSPDAIGSAGSIDTNGKVWLVFAAQQATALGCPGAGNRYLEDVAAAIGGTVKHYAKGTREAFGPDGRAMDVEALLNVQDRWKAAIARLIADTTASSSEA
jgi:hypothetical protein